MLRKFLSALVIIISFVSSSFAYSGGDGSSNNPYVISTENDLVEFRNNVNNASDDSGSYYILSNDSAGFQMTRYNAWTPVGNANSFTGHLEGNDKVIYVNMNTNSSIAFFGTIGSGASVSNLNIEGSVKSNADAAGFALTLDGGTLTNCRFSGQIYVDDAIPDDPTQNLNAAGLVGYMNSGTIENCIFNGEIKINGGIYPRAGGLVALMHGGSIKNCDVSHYSSVESYATEVEVTDDNDVVVPPSAIAGGIAGQVNIGLSETIEGCKFRGKVTAESWNTSYAGGIIGYMRGGTLKNNSVLDDSVISGKYTAGGIAGFLRTGGTVDNNTVEAGSVVTAESYSAGGIIGILDLGTVTNNESHASISGNASSKGGIIGKVTPATESPATRIISGNKYSGADYGIGSDASGSPSNEGSDETESPFYITTSATLPSKKLYDEYTQVFETNISSDSASWMKVSGDFPSGLTLSGNTLSGTPTETGTFEFTLRASLISSYKSSEKTFSLTIESQLNIITSSDLENGTSGREYGPVTLKTDAEDGAYVTWTASGLPAGLTLGNLTGILSGTPTTAGYYEFTVRASSGANTATKTFTITITPSLIITTDSELPSALINSAYSVTLASNVSDSENVIWSLVSSSLPSGLSLSTSGVISGTPTVSGTFDFTIQASVDGTDYTDSKDFELTVDPEITITTSSLASWKVGRSQTQTLTAGPSGLTFTWSLQSGNFPSDLTFDSSGIITGTPVTTGTYTFTVRASSGSLYADKTFTLTVNPAFSIITTSLDLGYAKMNQYYSFDLETDADDNSSVVWSVTGGSLPDGLSLASYSGRIYGTPTRAGYFTFTVRASSGGLTAEATLAITVRPTLSIITSSDLPAGVTGQTYSQNLETDAESGNIITWSFVSGKLPDGISFDKSTGILSGIPTKTGTFTFTIGAETGSYTAENKKFTLKIVRALTVTTASSLPKAKVSHAYSVNISAASIEGEEYTWTHTSGDIPDGLTLNESTSSTVTLSGTPTTEGTYTFTLSVSAAGMTAVRTFTLTVEPLLTITTVSLPDGKMNQSYSASLSAEIESSAFVTWSVSSGALPEGLILGSYTGAITGIPTRAGYFTFTIKAGAGSLSYEKEFGITITPSLTIITSQDLPDGIINVQYSQTLSSDAEAGNTVTWSLNRGSLPDGLTLNSSTGVISGIPTVTGTYTFNIAADAGNLTVSKDFNLTIRPELYITTDSNLPSVKVFHDYSVTLETALIAGSVFTWSLVSSDLPSGLTLNASTGTISGIPTTEGTYKFTVQVTADGRTASKEFTLEVRPSLYITTVSPLPTVKEGSYYEVKLETDIESDMIVMWSVISGDLPEGLTLRENTGVISGIPDTEGTYVFVIHAKAGQLESNKTFVLTVKPALSITTSSDLPYARPNESYSLKLETDAEALDAVKWEFISGDLPEGFAFNSQTGTISGISSREGVYEFTIKAEVQTTARRLTVQKKFVLAVRREIIITNTDSYTLNAGSYFSLNLDTFDSSAGSSFSWSVISGDIPEGLSLNAEGTLTGIPTRAGTFRFTLQVSHGYSQGRKDFTFTIKLAITSPSYLPNGTTGQNYSEILTAEGTNSAVWSLVSRDILPPGLSLTPAGLIHGVPTTEGTYNFNVNVSSDNGLNARKLLRITIDSDSPVTITTVSLPSGKAGVSYYAELHSGVSGVTWSITDGRLPNGLTLNASNGLISGTPTESGTFTFTLKAAYGSREGTRRLTLLIEPEDVIESNDKHEMNSSSGGGGCNTGLNLSMIFASLIFIFRRRF